MNGFCVLVPKQRGTGYLKVPYGHHPDAGLDNITDVAGCDLFGLDGHLHFETRFFFGAERRAAFEAKVVPMLEAHYGIPARAIDETDFWRLHPINGGSADNDVSFFR